MKHGIRNVLGDGVRNVIGCCVVYILAKTLVDDGVECYRRYRYLLGSNGAVIGSLSLEGWVVSTKSVVDGRLP